MTEQVDSWSAHVCGCDASTGSVGLVPAAAVLRGSYFRDTSAVSQSAPIEQGCGSRGCEGVVRRRRTRSAILPSATEGRGGSGGTMPSKTILCLANSRKKGGRCVAGKEVVGSQFGGWVRPVSARQEEEIADAERRYADGTRLGLLDIVKIPILGHTPGPYQPENYLINAGNAWEKVGAAKWSQVAAMLDKPATLWTNGSSSSNGFHDEVEEHEAASLGVGSLYLVRPDQLSLTIDVEGAAFGNPRRVVRASFVYAGVPYRFSVTDVSIEQHMRAKPNGSSETVSDAILCVSLGAVFKGYAYKLVATVLTLARVGDST